MCKTDVISTVCIQREDKKELELLHEQGIIMLVTKVTEWYEPITVYRVFFTPLNFHEYHELVWIREIKFVKC